MLAKAVVTSDPDLGQKMENTMKKWNVTLASLLAHRRSERGAWLMARARAYRASRFEKDTQYEHTRLNEEKQPIWTKWAGCDEDIEHTMKLRRQLALRGPAPGEACLKCLSHHGDHDHIRHILCACTNEDVVEQRKNTRTALPENMRARWNQLNTTEVAKLTNKPGESTEFLTAIMSVLRAAM